MNKQEKSSEEEERTLTVGKLFNFLDLPFVNKLIELLPPILLLIHFKQKHLQLTQQKKCNDKKAMASTQLQAIHSKLSECSIAIVVCYLSEVHGELLELLLRQANEHFRRFGRGPCRWGYGGGEVPRGHGGDAARPYCACDGRGANLVKERHWNGDHRWEEALRLLEELWTDANELRRPKLKPNLELFFFSEGFVFSLRFGVREDIILSLSKYINI